MSYHGVTYKWKKRGKKNHQIHDIDYVYVVGTAKSGAA